MKQQTGAPPPPLSRATDSRRLLPIGLAGFGGFCVVFLLAELTARFGTLLLIAPFGASCVLVFGMPESPLAQPRNVIGGHLVSTAVGLAVFAAFGATPLSFGIGVGFAIIAMLLTKTVHPPAGADPIVVILAAAGWSFLLMPVLVGALTIVLAGRLFRIGHLFERPIEPVAGICRVENHLHQRITF